MNGNYKTEILECMNQIPEMSDQDFNRLYRKRFAPSTAHVDDSPDPRRETIIGSVIMDEINDEREGESPNHGKIEWLENQLASVQSDYALAALHRLAKNDTANARAISENRDQITRVKCEQYAMMASGVATGIGLTYVAMQLFQ